MHPPKSRLQSLALRWLTVRPPEASFPHAPTDEAGVTLIESLVAMVIVSIIMLAMTPPIFLVVATRVQNRRAEQAMQLAQAEIDRVRVLVERGDYQLADLPANIGGGDVKTYAAASSILGQMVSSEQSCNTYTGTPVVSNTLLPVDVDGDCQQDYLVQTFRDEGEKVINDPTEPPITFEMGTRVYHAIAADKLGALGTDQASLSMTTGQKFQKEAPLATAYTTVIRGDAEFSLDRFRQELTGP